MIGLKFSILWAMTNEHQYIWFLDNYQTFLKHPEAMIRTWAAQRIQTQYPHLAAESLTGLLTDPDSSLQIMAAQAIGQSGDPRYEPTLLAAWTESKGSAKSWMTATLGKLQSPTLLPHLLTELAAIPANYSVDERRNWAVVSMIDAVGHYPDQAAQSALWQFVERYQSDDRLTCTAFQGLLRFANPDTLPRLVQCYSQLNPRALNAWEHTVIALADVFEIPPLIQDMIRVITDSLDDMILLLDEWLDQEVIYSETFELALDEAIVNRTYSRLLPHILVELERVITERNDDLSAWLAAWHSGKRPTGYRWRTLYGHQLITALVEQPPLDPKQLRDVVALAVTVLGLILTDQDDEALLETAPNELIRQVMLLDIMESPRIRIGAVVIDQIVALGPGMVSHLINILKGNHFWAITRTLETLRKIAWAQPGTADKAVLDILELMDADQTDEVMEAAGDTLVAIGPAAVALAIDRLGQIDFAYDIYVCAAVSNIPTQASVVWFLEYLIRQGSIEEYEVEALVDLGHTAAISYLTEHYEWADDPMLCTALYKLSLLNNYTGPELAKWRTTALEDEAAFKRTLAEMESKG